jgi:diguanylate cyclase (GGDEF)-like protein
MAPITVILADIDSFKAYNDHYGHLGGDEILRRVAQALSGIVLRGGDLVARYGGEELVVVLADTGLQAGAEHAERMRAVVEALRIPHASSVAGPHLTISVGVAACAAGEPPVAEDLIARADQALYLAKSSGRNRVCVYAPSMT